MSVKDIVLSTAEIAGKTVVSAIPVGGTLISCVFDAVKSGCLEKRQKQWREILEKRLAEVETTLEKLSEDNLFVTSLIKSTELAMKTSRAEKLTYLANAVVNSLSPDLDEEKLIVFLDLLDKYTVSHIKIMYFFYNPQRFEEIDSCAYLMGTPSTPLFCVYPELNNELFKKIYKDLYVDGMVSLENLNITMSGSGMVAKRTTTIGDEFLKFIFDNGEL